MLTPTTPPPITTTRACVRIVQFPAAGRGNRRKVASLASRRAKSTRFATASLLAASSRDPKRLALRRLTADGRTLNTSQPPRAAFPEIVHFAMKNLLILHLESLSRQRLDTFSAALPHTRRLMQEGVFFDNFYASATSTMMVVSYLFHGNDFEFDTSTAFEGMAPAGNNPNLFSILRKRGYHSNLVCLNGFQHVRPIELGSWPPDLPPVWGTHDFVSLFARFDELTDKAPFAIYVWDLITHIEHSLALSKGASGLTDQLRRAWSVADDAIGRLRAILERKGLLENTTVVLYGDHGDDPWTHGFKGGLTHGTEPYTDIIWTPLAIRDPALAPGTVDRVARTIDIAPTCLGLLGIDEQLAFPHSGLDLFRATGDFAYAQNFTANQPDNPKIGVAKAFSITDPNHTLLASSRGLELYAHRLDPGNHFNLLHLFELDKTGRPRLLPQPGAAGHFKAGWQDNPASVEGLADDYMRLKRALSARIEAKRAYIVERGAAPRHALERGCLDAINVDGREAFFRRAGRPAGAAAPSMPKLDITYKLR